MKTANLINTLKKFRDKKEILLNNILSAATVCARTKTGRYKGFIAYLKNCRRACCTLHHFLLGCVRAVIKITSI